MDQALLRCGRFRLELKRTLVMGIVNVTPDSFSDGGLYLSAADAIARAEQLIGEGADLLDIGAESSRPGALPLPMDLELERLLPVLVALRDVAVPISVDTYKPEVMRHALDTGASMINDIWALRQPGALEVVAGADCALCVMHMRGEPTSMQHNPAYDDVVAEVRQFLAGRLASLEAAGVGRERVVIDPGFGFGKTPEQNYALLRSLESIVALGQPVLAGLSRKSMLGHVTGRSPAAREAASVAAALAAVAHGARLVRVHDVGMTVDALKIWEMVENRPSAAVPTDLNNKA